MPDSLAESPIASSPDPIADDSDEEFVAGISPLFYCHYSVLCSVPLIVLSSCIGWQVGMRPLLVNSFPLLPRLVMTHTV